MFYQLLSIVDQVIETSKYNNLLDENQLNYYIRWKQV
jgi:hypothetical protein